MIEPGKRIKALEAWANVLREKYGVIPTFVHTDKDMAEIGMVRKVWWEAKIQLCWWHLREAVRKRLKGKLNTSKYNVLRSQSEFLFISSLFTPRGRADQSDMEGGTPEENDAAVLAPHITPVGTATAHDPNAIKIRIPFFPNLTQKAPDPIKIRIPFLPKKGTAGDGPDNGNISQETEDENEDGEQATPQHTFCPAENRDNVVDLMERHLCAHPFIPGYSAPTPEGIKFWAVKEMYEFCVEHDLRNLWAYLWENWYRQGRWELWARSANPDAIPRLKTTMMVEAQ